MRGGSRIGNECTGRSLAPVHVQVLLRARRKLGQLERRSSPSGLDENMETGFFNGRNGLRPWWPVIRQTAPLGSAARTPPARTPLRLVLFNERLLSSSRFYKYGRRGRDTRVAMVAETSARQVPKEKPSSGAEREITPGRDVRYGIISRSFTATGQIASLYLPGFTVSARRKSRCPYTWDARSSETRRVAYNILAAYNTAPRGGCVRRKDRALA